MKIDLLHYCGLSITFMSLLLAQGVQAAPVDCNATLNANLVQDLSFGDYEGTTGGTITVDTSGARTATAGIALAGGTVSAATYVFSNIGKNCDKKWIYITMPATITISGPASMTVNNLVNSEALNGNKFKLNSTTTVTIGADLVTNNLQTPGPYNGNFDVDFSY